MLRKNASRIRHQRHRLYAAPALCRQQISAAIPKRLFSIGMPEFEFAPEPHSSRIICDEPTQV
jgi:hypothetical protein